jgi:hypothetical protein
MPQLCRHFFQRSIAELDTRHARCQYCSRNLGNSPLVRPKCQNYVRFLGKLPDSQKSGEFPGFCAQLKHLGVRIPVNCQDFMLRTANPSSKMMPLWPVHLRHLYSSLYRCQCFPSQCFRRIDCIKYKLCYFMKDNIFSLCSFYTFSTKHFQLVHRTFPVNTPRTSG